MKTSKYIIYFYPKNRVDLGKNKQTNKNIKQWKKERSAHYLVKDRSTFSSRLLSACCLRCHTPASAKLWETAVSVDGIFSPLMFPLRCFWPGCASGGAPDASHCLWGKWRVLVWGQDCILARGKGCSLLSCPATPPAIQNLLRSFLEGEKKKKNRKKKQ